MQKYILLIFSIFLISSVSALTTLDEAGADLDGNVTADWGFLKLNWSYLRAIPALSNFSNDILWTSSFNTTGSSFWLNLSGTNANQNMNITPYNLTSNFYFGNGSRLSDICLGNGTNCQNNNSIFNSTYHSFAYNQTGVWGYNQTIPAITDIDSRFWNRTQTWNVTQLYNITQIDSFNMSWSSTFNSTYNNLVNNLCPTGKVVNGTLSNGTFICTTVASDGTGGWTNTSTQTITNLNILMNTTNSNRYVFWNATSHSFYIYGNPESGVFPYMLNLVSNDTNSYMGIFNNEGTNKGFFFGVSGNASQAYQYQGALASSGAFPFEIYAGYSAPLVLSIDSIGTTLASNLTFTNGFDKLRFRNGVANMWVDSPAIGVMRMNANTKNRLDVAGVEVLNVTAGGVGVTGNATITQMIKLSPITLPSCDTANNGTLARNTTGLIYACPSGAGTWVLIS